MTEDYYLKEGYFVFLDSPYNKYFRVARREPFDFITGQEQTTIFSTVAPGAQSGFKNIETLEPDKDPLHLFQVLWGVADVSDGDLGVKYYVKIPAGQNRFGVDEAKEIGFIDATKSPWYDPNPLYSFWLIADTIPSINCVNNSAVTITPKIWFRGMKYNVAEIVDQALLQKIQNGNIPFRSVMFGGVDNTP